MTFITRSKRLIAGLGAIAALVFVAGCSSATPQSGGDSGGAGGLPATLDIFAIQDLTGPAGFPGTSTRQGAELALEEINETGFLGDTTLSLDYHDTASKPPEGAALATQAVNSSTPILLGPLLSQVGQVMSPIVQRGGLPTIYTQMGADGVNIGEYTYRATTTVAALFEDGMGAYLKDQGVKTVSAVYASDNDAHKNMGEITVPAVVKEEGMQLLSQEGILTSTTDFTALASKIVEQNPDALGIFVLPPQYPVLIKQLREFGYEGLIFAVPAAGGGTLDPIGALGNGVTWATYYDSTVPGTVAEEFLRRYQAKYGADKVPSSFTADGYDAMWLAARALKEANSTDRADVLAALETVTSQPIEGAVGEITFKDRDHYSPAVIVQWENGAQVVVK